nr:fibroblast growth factor 2 [Dromaius novaehollandiae]
MRHGAGPAPALPAMYPIPGRQAVTYQVLKRGFPWQCSGLRTVNSPLCTITTLPALPDDGGSGAFPPGHFKDPKRLYCKNGGFFLRINPDGRVDGVREKSDPHIKLQLQAEERGVVSIKGVSANRFLAMKEDGRLLALKCATEECFFFERLESNNYNTYRSRKYSDWYVALKRTGQYKPGPKTGPGQKAILFLPMSAKS